MAETFSDELCVGDEEVEANDSKQSSKANFEKVYRMLIEQAWQSDPAFRPDATNMREILERTAVS